MCVVCESAHAYRHTNATGKCLVSSVTLDLLHFEAGYLMKSELIFYSHMYFQ